MTWLHHKDYEFSETVHTESGEPYYRMHAVKKIIFCEKLKEAIF